MQEQPYYTLYSVGWDEVCPFGNRIYHCYDCIIFKQLQKFNHKIYTDGIPHYIWYSQQEQFSK